MNEQQRRSVDERLQRRERTFVQRQRGGGGVAATEVRSCGLQADGSAKTRTPQECDGRERRKGERRGEVTGNAGERRW